MGVDSAIHTKGWIFGYKLHMISSTGSIIVPLAADFTTANVQNNQMYNPMISSSLTPETCLMIGDSGYDDHKLYDLSTKRGFELVCPVQRYKNTPNNRLELIQFYESELDRLYTYSWRSKSIEPLIEHIKSVFRIDPLPVRGYQMVAGIVLLSILLSQILSINHKIRRSQRTKAIKHMLCS